VSALVLACNTVALVALAFFGWRTLRSVLLSIDGMADMAVSILRSLAEIDARLCALEAKPNGADPHAPLMRDGRGQVRTM
jgi:hypothetical protein